MKSEDLLKYIGEVDDEFVDELFCEPSVKKKSNHRWGLMAACLAVFLLGSGFMYHFRPATKSGTVDVAENGIKIAAAENSIIMLDVNPSMRFEVDDRGKVVSAVAVNDDAEPILDELELCELAYDEAITESVDALCNSGYVSSLKNSVLVTVLNKDEQQAERMLEAAVGAIDKYDEGLHYDLSVLSQTMTDEGPYKELAEKYRISSGRMKLLEALCDGNDSYELEDLVNNNVHTINQLLEYVGLPDFLSRKGETSGTVPVDYRESLSLETLSGGDILSFTNAISDFYDKMCAYYSEEDVANRFGYVFNIAESKNNDGTPLWNILVKASSEEAENYQGAGTQGAVIHRGDRTVTNFITSNLELLGKIGEAIFGHQR